MGNFFAELKRRHIYRVAAAYAVVAWVLLQIVNNIAPGLNLPNSAVTLVIVLLAVGFPIALVFAWALELKAPAQDKAAGQAKITKLDFALLGALVVVIGIFGYQQLATTTGTKPAQHSSFSPATGTPAGGISIAVLPFANLSGDAGQEFFSDGMTEEITAALAKIPNLRVVARTSAFAFKGQNQDMRAVGQALSASHLIEGSVRKDGNQVRITAQLIKANDGTHLWTESYDRQLTGIFAVQEDIAQAIAGALRVPLGLRQGETLVSNRTSDLDSYQEYLRARALFRARNLTRAVATLEPVVSRDPNYAPAWGLLAVAYTFGQVIVDVRQPIEEARRTVQSDKAKGEMAAREAIRLDPRHAALGYVALALVTRNLAAAEDLYHQALAVDPDDPDALHSYGNWLTAVGHLKQAMSVREKLLRLEPFVTIYNDGTAVAMQLTGQREAAIKLLEAIPPGDAGVPGANRNVFLAMAYATGGRFAEAADMILATTESRNYSRQSLEDAARLLRTAPAKVSAPDALPALDTGLMFVYTFVGAPNRILEFPERMVEIGSFIGNGNRWLWHPLNASVRKTERFKILMRKEGFVEYWRARGWPDLCHPTTGDDFECN